MTRADARRRGSYKRLWRMSRGLAHNCTAINRANVLLAWHTWHRAVALLSLRSIGRTHLCVPAYPTASSRPVEDAPNGAKFPLPSPTIKWTPPAYWNSSPGKPQFWIKIQRQILVAKIMDLQSWVPTGRAKCSRTLRANVAGERCSGQCRYMKRNSLIVRVQWRQMT